MHVHGTRVLPTAAPANVARIEQAVFSPRVETMMTTIVSLTRTKPKLSIFEPVNYPGCIQPLPSFDRDAVESALETGLASNRPVKRVERLVSCADLVARTEEDLAKQLAHSLFALDCASPTSQPSQPPPYDDAALMCAFNASREVTITVQAYLQRLIKYLHKVARVEQHAEGRECCPSDLGVRYLVGAHIFIQRIRALRGLKLTQRNAHRFIIVGVVVACKCLDDEMPTMDYFAQLGGLSVRELAALELAFLKLLGWNCSLDAQLFNQSYDVACGGTAW